MPISTVKASVLISLCLILVACGGSKNIPVKVHSDPLGAYALMKISYKNGEDSDWIFLGPTPVIQDRKMAFDGASTVSLKVIRPGFFEQVKTWKAKDFVKEAKQKKQILWVPSLVQQ